MGAFARLPETETSAPAATLNEAPRRWRLRWTFAFVTLVCSGFWAAVYFLARAIF
jgi:hypothetical protein